MRSLFVAAFLSLSAAAFADAPPPEAAKHPAGIEKSVGVISGGWEYVYAAYTLGLLGVLGYATSLFVRRNKPERAP